MLEVISLGAGVQSTTMALMAAHGEITPMPDAAIFADTGAEPRAVYEHLDWLRSGNVLPFPVHVARLGDLSEDIEATSRGEPVRGRQDGFMAVPFFVKNLDGEQGLLRRQCTREYKLLPIERKTKELLGLDPTAPVRSKGALARQWVGISADEWVRAKASTRRWLEIRHPLIERANGRWLTRGHCLEWLQDKGYPLPPRSACVYCPYRGGDEWRAVRDVPEDWALALRVDTAAREAAKKGLAGLDGGGEIFAHRSMQPLADADLTDPHENQLDLWQAECEGLCGV